MLEGKAVSRAISILDIVLSTVYASGSVLIRM